LSADGKICEGSAEQGDLAPNGGEMAPLCREIRQQRNAGSISTVAEAALDVCGGLTPLGLVAGGGKSAPPSRAPDRFPRPARTPPAKTGRGSPPQSDDANTYLFANDPLWAVCNSRHGAPSREHAPCV